MTPHKLFKSKFSVAGVCVFFGVALVLLPGRLAAGQDGARVPTIDQALEMQSASGAALSPDGQRVVYEVSRTNWKDNAFERDLWIADRAGSTHLLTAQVKSSSGARWSPDGRWIAFASDRPGQVLRRRRIRDRST
jgi:Tol biopolymer transport system component